MAAELCWGFTTATTKVSLIFLYQRVFPQRGFRLYTYGVLAVVVSYGIGVAIYFLTACRPFEASWDPLIRGNCVDPHKGWLGTGISNVLTDALVLTAPMYKVWGLQLPGRTKLAVGAVFGIGFVYDLPHPVTLLSSRRTG